MSRWYTFYHGALAVVICCGTFLWSNLCCTPGR